MRSVTNRRCRAFFSVSVSVNVSVSGMRVPDAYAHA
ncbi:hypothetical protein R8871_00244 [Paraburkholderia graminis C4D1M]|jgi:hypothetical protein|uniref:Uncharacterized protein n=1 Tax=Paraburkholderia graminis (strain ATCC 700544 / DSM 17151 / LMG 18924 / NCIMB 13744 / C4D1M) TaxID=396598 RepID=B1FZE4_PARG4|nr:hypothetical protein BgramDRAFT_2481 [Paraburkholderia graminis C4D1M]CAB3640624.1 hypothetical protein R8871_00244 [Paraburkholderia graminis C4D1M]